VGGAMPRSPQIYLLAIFFLSVAPLTLRAQEKKHGPLTEGAIINLLHGGVAPERVASLAQEYGITFQMTPAVENDLRTAGATEPLIQTLRGLAPKTVPPQPVKQEPSTPKPIKQEPGQIPQMWHSVGTLHDFRVQIANDAFHAEWVNIPPADARQGAYIRTDCRRKGTKWVGLSNSNTAFPLRKARGGRDTKYCQLSLQFEVDSVTPDKITGHAESPKKFDANKCHMSQTTWGEFTWVPID
jgi:hypothetical protein